MSNEEIRIKALEAENKALFVAMQAEVLKGEKGIKALEDLALELWHDYYQHDPDCCEADRPDLITEILEKRR